MIGAIYKNRDLFTSSVSPGGSFHGILIEADKWVNEIYGKEKNHLLVVFLIGF
jgi:hypothetical protein